MGNGSTNFVRGVTKEEHADDRPCTTSGRHDGATIADGNLFLPVDPSQH